MLIALHEGINQLLNDQALRSNYRNTYGNGWQKTCVTMPAAAYGKMQQEEIKKLRAAKYPIP